jgi:acetylornithine deacetylase/succinyl-diaminopimelate desuccinylase-like protein
VDVVTTENQEWENDPFGGEIVDGFVWGRGALDMKSGVAMMLAAVTDARFFSRLGIQTYGFTPMQLPPGMDFAKIVHGANERIPVEAVSFRADAIYQVLQRFHE